MTNKEAIEMLKSKMNGKTDTSYEWVETVRLAINALEKIEELEDKHWEECHQIALYDDEVKQLKKEIAEKYVKREEGRGK